MAKRRSACPISFTLDLVGDRWTLLVLRDVLFKGRSTYSEFLEAGEGISTNILASRLSLLKREGFLRRLRSKTDHKTFIFTPTAKALSLVPLMLEIVKWGAEHDPKTAAPREFVDRIDNNRNGLIAEILGSFSESKTRGKGAGRK